MTPKDTAFLVFAVLLTAGILYWAIAKKRKTRELWGKFARRYSGRVIDKDRKWYQPWRFHADCKKDGIEITLEFYVVRHGKSSTTYTRFRADCPEGFHAFSYPESVFHKIGKMVGAEDHQLGHYDYDKVFMIKSRTPDALDRVFDQELRRLHLLDPAMELAFDEGRVSVVRKGLHRDERVLTRMLDLCARASQNARSLTRS